MSTRNFHEAYDIKTLLKAYCKLNAEIQENYKLILIGKGPCEKELKQIAIDNNLKKTRSNSKRYVAIKTIDISNIVLETDSPYLSPSPLRGKRNESANIKYIAEKLCDIYNLSFQEIADITTENSKNIFGFRIPIIF